MEEEAGVRVRPCCFSYWDGGTPRGSKQSHDRAWSIRERARKPVVAENVFVFQSTSQHERVEARKS